jgi:CheY-like chemotaxis protein
MSLKGPILLIDDDTHDLDVICAALKENKVENKIRSFLTAKEGLDYLNTTKEQPFIILADIRMNEMNGLEFRKAIEQNEFLKKKSIPFVFLTEAVSQEIVDEAYDLTVQGFFRKPNNFSELRRLLDYIVSFWKMCIHPNSF